jgi:hypothetical protein
MIPISDTSIREIIIGKIFFTFEENGSFLSGLAKIIPEILFYYSSFFRGWYFNRGLNPAVT